MHELLNHTNERLRALQAEAEQCRVKKEHVKHVSLLTAIDELLRVKKIILHNYHEK